jgi:hypothetical protein
MFDWTVRSYDVASRQFGQVMAEGSAVTGKTVLLPKTEDMSLGSWLFEARAKDAQGRPVEASTEFIVWNSDANNRPLSLKSDLVEMSSTKYQKGESIDIWWAAAEADAHIFWYLADVDTLLSAQYVQSPTTTLSHFRVLPEMLKGDGVTFLLQYVKNGAVHQYTREASLTTPDKQLQLKWTRSETCSFLGRKRSGRCLSAIPRANPLSPISSPQCLIPPSTC